MVLHAAGEAESLNFRGQLMMEVLQDSGRKEEPWILFLSTGHF